MFLILDANLYRNHSRKILLRSIKSFILKRFLPENTIRNIKILKIQNNLRRKFYPQQVPTELHGVQQRAERKKAIIKMQNVSPAII
jgi:hypothetical protein